MKYVQRHKGTFDYAGRIVPFYFWSHRQADEVPDAVIFLGTGQTGRVAQWAAQAAPAGVVVVEGAPHWHAHPSAHDIGEFMSAYTHCAFRTVLDEFSLSSAHIIAQSQAAPGVVKLANSWPERVNNVVLIAPLGLTATIFGDTPEVRMRTLMRRVSRTFMQVTQSPLYDLRNLYIGFMILRAILLESERGASKRKYAAGLAYDMLEDCRTLVLRQRKRHKHVVLLLGDKDKLFTVREIRSLVSAAGIRGLEMHVLPGVSHLSLAVRAGKKVLQTAIYMARV